MPQEHQRLAFPWDAWVVNWTLRSERGDGAQRHYIVTVGEEAPEVALATEPEVALVGCVLLSIFGTLVALFLLFQFVLYIRFCITGHHDWKWSLPYLLRMRRVECMRRRGGEERGGLGEEDVCWDAGGVGGIDEEPVNNRWVHVYPKGKAPSDGRLSTARSISGYFRSMVASKKSVLKPRTLPAAVFLVNQRNPARVHAKTGSSNIPTNTPSWLTGDALSGSRRWTSSDRSRSAISPDPLGKGDTVLFHCENPGYDSDASLCLSATDDEGANTDPGGNDASVSVSGSVRNSGELRTGDTTGLSDESFTSISSISLSSSTRGGGGGGNMGSLSIYRKNSYSLPRNMASGRSKVSNRSRASRKRQNISAHAETNRTKARTTDGRCGSIVPDKRGASPGRRSRSSDAALLMPSSWGYLATPSGKEEMPKSGHGHGSLSLDRRTGGSPRSSHGYNSLDRMSASPSCSGRRSRRSNSIEETRMLSLVTCLSRPTSPESGHVTCASMASGFSESRNDLNKLDSGGCKELRFGHGKLSDNVGGSGGQYMGKQVIQAMQNIMLSKSNGRVPSDTSNLKVEMGTEPDKKTTYGAGSDLKERGSDEKISRF